MVATTSLNLQLLGFLRKLQEFYLNSFDNEHSCVWVTRTNAPHFTFADHVDNELSVGRYINIKQVTLIKEHEGLTK